MKQSRKYSRGWLTPVVLLLGLLTLYVLFLYLFGGKTTSKDIQRAQQNPNNDENEDDTIVLKSINRAWSDGINPLYLLAIAKHETGNFTSDVFRNNNNMFGMRHPNERKTTSQGELNGYARYNSIEDSVRDFKLWIDAKQLGYNYNDVSDLIRAMKDNQYMEASYSKYNNAVVNHLIDLVERYGA